MADIALDVWLEGFATPVGSLHRSSAGDLVFRYTEDHLANDKSVPLSLSLPLRPEMFGDVPSRSYFSNLLQERDAPLRELMARYQIERHDVAALLFHLGKDCSGAVSVLPAGSLPVKSPGDPNRDYDDLQQAQLEEIVLALHRREPLPLGRRDTSPLSGVQSKIAICCWKGATQFALPKPDRGAPTTHVMKVPTAQNTVDVHREQLAMKLSAMCGIETCVAEVKMIAGIPVLITVRFDRGTNTSGHIIRAHQEDFAQALGLSPELKYEKDGMAGHRFDASAIGQLIAMCEQPATAVLRFLAIAIFDLLIGNADGHAKNHALTYRGGRAPRIAPRYDILPTRLDASLSDQLAYSIGRAKQLQDVERQDFRALLAQLGVGRVKSADRMVQEKLQGFVPVLAENLEVLQSLNQKSFADLIAANMRELLPKLDYPVPKQAEARDAFIPKGGGWGSS